VVAIRKLAEVHDEFGWLADCEVSAERPQVDGQRIDGVGAGVENAVCSSTASTEPTARVRGSIRSPEGPPVLPLGVPGRPAAVPVDQAMWFDDAQARRAAVVPVVEAEALVVVQAAVRVSVPESITGPGRAGRS
jgi:hypothetical protein